MLCMGGNTTRTESTTRLKCNLQFVCTACMCVHIKGVSAFQVSGLPYVNREIFMNIKLSESRSNLVGRNATKDFVSLTIDCLYLYFGTCAEIYICDKKFVSGDNLRETRILLVAKNSQFRAYGGVPLDP